MIDEYPREESALPTFKQFLEDTEGTGGVNRGRRITPTDRRGNAQNRLGGKFTLTDDAAFVYWDIFPLEGDEPLDAELTRYMRTMQSKKSGRRERSSSSILALFLVRFGKRYEAKFKQFIPTAQIEQPGVTLTSVADQSPTVDEEDRITVDEWIDEGLFVTSTGAIDALLQFAAHMGLTTAFKSFVVEELIAEPG